MSRLDRCPGLGPDQDRLRAGGVNRATPSTQPARPLRPPRISLPTEKNIVFEMKEGGYMDVAGTGSVSEGWVFSVSPPPGGAPVRVMKGTAGQQYGASNDRKFSNMLE